MARIYLIKIRVTEEDIKNGECGSPTNCPIALACKKRKEFSLGKIEVDKFFILYMKHKKFFLPEIAKSFIEKFDSSNNLEFSPFEFELEIY